MLDIQKYGGNSNLLCYHGVVERNRISSLQSHGKALEKECCLPDVFRDSGDTPANLLCELNGHLMHDYYLFINYIVVYCSECWLIHAAGVSSRRLCCCGLAGRRTALADCSDHCPSLRFPVCDNSRLL